MSGGGGGSGATPALLIGMQVRRARNYVRYHFDRGTIVRLALLAAVVLAGLIPGFNAVADLPRRGDAWNPWPRLALCFVLSIPWGVRRDAREGHGILAILPIPRGTMALYDLAHRLAVPVFLAFVLSFVDVVRAFLYPAWWPRVLVDLAGGTLAGVLGTAAALMLRRFRRHRHPARGAVASAARRGRLSAALGSRGGAVQGLVRRDLLHLARRHGAAPWTAAGGAVLSAIAAARAASPDQGAILVVLLAAITGLGIVNLLVRLFEADVDDVAALRILPLAGRDLWRARWITALCVSAPAGLAGAAVLAFRPEGGAAAATAGGVSLLVSLVLTTLYANIGLAVFPAIRMIELFLNMAWALPLMAWFLAPPLSILLIAAALIDGFMRGPRAWDRLEVTG